MEFYVKPVHANGTKILEIFDENINLIDRYIKKIINLELKVEEDWLGRTYADILRSLLESKIKKFRILIENNIELFNNYEFAQILLSDLLKVRGDLLNLRDPEALSSHKIVLDSVNFFITKFENIKLSIISLQNANNLIQLQLQPAIDEVKEKVKDFDSLRLALEQRETSTIYLKLHDKYKSEFIINNALFFLSLFSGALLTLYSTNLSSVYIRSLSNYAEATRLDQWFILITIKILIITLTITLCTLFLRRSAHAKKLYEQAYQTHVEINAFPIHVRSLKEEDKHELIKELAMKYFGKELDQTQNDKIGDLMKDQLTAGTELIKVSAELVKAKGGSTTPP